MTIREIKDAFSDYVKLKVKGNLPDDYNVTEEDIINDNIFQRFVDSNNIAKIVSGLDVIDGKIYYIYPEIIKIEVDTDGVFPPCGGSIKINTYAYYNLSYVTVNGDNGFISENNKSLVNPIVKLDNDEFTYKNRVLEKNTPNDTEELITCNWI